MLRISCHSHNVRALRLRHWFALAAATVISWTAANPLIAKEEPEIFLAELRDRGYFDVAIDYLESITKTDLVSEEFKASVPYEKTQLIIAQASLKSDPARV